MAAATRTLALLNEQADGLRAELLALRQDLAEVQRDFSEAQGAELREAYEQLVLAALHAETIAETAVNNLGELAHSSQRDALTGTPNRALMLDRLEQAIAMARRHGTHLAVFFLDLDGFKKINDTLGHAIGDEVLQTVARRLELTLRDSDNVSRHSGDEFLVLLPDIARVSDASVIAGRMLSALAVIDHVGDQSIHLSASIGIAVYPDDGEDASTLISRADTAMYRSKRLGNSGFQFYREMHPSEPKVRSSVQDLRLPETRHESALVQHETHLRHLREANEHLVIAALTAEELKARAEDARRQQVRFLAMVAHELRSPLTSIRTVAELLNRARADEPRLAQLDTVVRRQVAHMARFVEDLLDGPEAGTGTFRLERSTVDMADVVGMAVETCRPAMDARLQRLKVKLPPSPLLVQGDPVRLAQVFCNLLDNASRCAPEGGKVALLGVILDHALEITISDNGAGISLEDLPHVFDLFEQATQPLDPHDRRPGIGLAVVRDLVRAHGGRAVARSAGRGSGSEFIITLPLAGGPAGV